MGAPDKDHSARLFPVIIDSGFTTSPLPPSLVHHYYSAFAEYPVVKEIDGQRMYALPCDTRDVPLFGVHIGGQNFEMFPQSTLVGRLNTTDEDGTLFCGMGVQPGLEEAGALGDTFLSDVLAVFDVGASEMRFAQRKFEWFEDYTIRKNAKHPVDDGTKPDEGAVDEAGEVAKDEKDEL